MSSLRNSYEKLPEKEQNRIFDLLDELLKYRGSLIHGGAAMQGLAKEIAEVFAKHTGEIAEYT